MKKKSRMLQLAIASLLFSQSLFSPAAMVLANESEQEQPQTDLPAADETAEEEAGFLSDDESMDNPEEHECPITQEVLDRLPFPVVLKSMDGDILESREVILRLDQITAQPLRSSDNSGNPVYNYKVWLFRINNPEEFGFDNAWFDPEASHPGGSIAFIETRDPYYSTRGRLIFCENPDLDNPPAIPPKEDLSVPFMSRVFLPDGEYGDGGKSGRLSPDQFKVSEPYVNEEGRWEVVTELTAGPDELVDNTGLEYILVTDSDYLTLKHRYKYGEWVLRGSEADEPCFFAAYLIAIPKPKPEKLKILVVTEDENGEEISSEETNILENTSELSELKAISRPFRERFEVSVISYEEYAPDPNYELNPEKSVLSTSYTCIYNEENKSGSGWAADGQIRLVFRPKKVIEDNDSPVTPKLADLNDQYTVQYLNADGQWTQESLAFEEGEYSISTPSQNEAGKWTVTLTSLIEPDKKAWGSDKKYHYIEADSLISADYVYEEGVWRLSGEDAIRYVYFSVPDQPDVSYLKLDVVYEDEQGNEISSETRSLSLAACRISPVMVGEDDRSAFVQAEVTDPSYYRKRGYGLNEEKSRTMSEYRFQSASDGSLKNWTSDEPLKLVFARKKTVNEDGTPLQPEKEDLQIYYSCSTGTPMGQSAAGISILKEDQFTLGPVQKNADGKWYIQVDSLIEPGQLQPDKKHELYFMKSLSSLSCILFFENGEWICPEDGKIHYVYMQLFEKPVLDDLKIAVITEDSKGNVISSEVKSVLKETAELSEISVDEKTREEYLYLNILSPEAYGSGNLKFSPEKSEVQAKYNYGFTDQDHKESDWTARKQAKLVFVQEEKKFSDVSEQHWAYDVIAEASSKGIMTGISETEFGANRPMTRAMVATVIYRLAGSPEVKAANPFKDVPKGTYYYDAITWCYENGIVRGFSSTQFAPETSIIRQQIAVIVRNYVQYAGKDVSGRADLSRFKDYYKVSDYAREAMEFCVSAGIISGAANGTLLNPGMTATRAEGAKIFLLVSEL